MWAVRRTGFIVTLMLLVSGCAGGIPAPQRSSDVPASAPVVASSPKHVTMAIAGSPNILSNKFNPSTNKPGLDVLEQLISGALTNFDSDDNLVPQLGEAAPTLDNGNWKLLPDGKM